MVAGQCARMPMELLLAVLSLMFDPGSAMMPDSPLWFAVDCSTVPRIPIVIPKSELSLAAVFLTRLLTPAETPAPLLLAVLCETVLSVPILDARLAVVVRRDVADDAVVSDGHAVPLVAADHGIGDGALAHHDPETVVEDVDALDRRTLGERKGDAGAELHDRAGPVDVDLRGRDGGDDPRGTSGPGARAGDREAVELDRDAAGRGGWRDRDASPAGGEVVDYSVGASRGDRKRARADVDGRCAGRPAEAQAEAHRGGCRERGELPCLHRRPPYRGFEDAAIRWRAARGRRPDRGGKARRPLAARVRRQERRAARSSARSAPPGPRSV